jgi:alpha-L-fucosidase
VFLAAAFAQSGMDVDRLVELLEEKSPEAFQFDSGGVTWRDEMIVRGQLRNSRNLLAIAFGSCSFEEPIEDLKKIDLL